MHYYNLFVHFYFVKTVHSYFIILRHTHRGQLWPLNFITDVVYTLDHGYAKINDKHFFTSAGYGFWGPPFKTSARSEVWLITIEGK